MPTPNLNILRTVSRIEDAVKAIPIHEFQAGVIYAYKDLPKLLSQKRINFFTNGDFCVGSDYYCIKTKTRGEIDRVVRHVGMNALFFIPELKPTKRVEVTYRLSEVFERANYETSKKFYKHVTRPFKVFEKEGLTIRELTRADIPAAQKLCRRWVKYKLDNYKLFRIMFPEKRYERCLLASFDEGMQNKIRVVGVFDSPNKGGQILGYRVIYKCGTNGYDLAYITDRDTDYTDFSEHFETVTLNFFRERYGVDYFNCGLSEGDLKRFKCHLPHGEAVYYRYAQTKK